MIGHPSGWSFSFWGLCKIEWPIMFQNPFSIFPKKFDSAFAPSPSILSVVQSIVLCLCHLENNDSDNFIAEVNTPSWQPDKIVPSAI
jgi:hypothetical protein